MARALVTRGSLRREDLEQAEQVPPGLVPILARGAPDDVEQPVEAGLDPAHGQVDVGHPGLRVHVVGVVGRRPAGRWPGRRSSTRRISSTWPQAHGGHRVAGVGRQHLLERGRRGVQVAALHGLLGLGERRVAQRGRPGPSMAERLRAGPAGPSARRPAAGAAAASPSCSATCMTWPSHSLTCGSGMAPRKPSATWPATTATTMGMLCTCRAALSCGLASTSTLARTQAPSASAASFSRIGAELLARPAPLGPQVHDDRDGPRPGDDLGVERLVGDVDDIAAGAAGRSGRAGPGPHAACAAPRPAGRPGRRRPGEKKPGAAAS